MSTSLAQQWFKAHPKMIIVFHWRADAVSAANRESMFNYPRTAKVRGRAVDFTTSIGGSTLSLTGISSDVDGDLLHLFDSNGMKFITYQALPEA